MSSLFQSRQGGEDRQMGFRIFDGGFFWIIIIILVIFALFDD